MEGLETVPWSQLLIYALAISVVAILVRFIWVFPATYVPRMISSRLREHDPAPPWQYPFVVAFTGVRGVVSLAAALSVPFVLASGEPFPDRSLILFLTFSVIVVTLVLQGPTLPWLVRWLGLHEVGAVEAHQRDQLEAQVRTEAARESLDRLGQIAETAGLAPEHAARIRELQRDRVGRLEGGSTAIIAAGNWRNSWTGSSWGSFKASAITSIDCRATNTSKMKYVGE